MVLEKVETMTDAEETDWKATQESGKTLKANMEAASDIKGNGQSISNY